jgi:hypothetical protein
MNQPSLLGAAFGAIFSPVERAAVQPGYRYIMAQMELATDIVFKRSAPLQALFQRACELGVLVGGR